jgi:Arc/MetJ-type ribon-helix-helix transcriptional regulator
MSEDRPEGLIEGVGRRGEPRRLDQMISVRLDPTLVASLRHLAAKRGGSLSDVLREAALLLLRQEEAANLITFEMTVTNEHRGTVARDAVRQHVEIAV